MMDGSVEFVKYGELIADFLAAFACKQELGGYTAFEGVLVRSPRQPADNDRETRPPELAVRAQHKVMVFVSVVLGKMQADTKDPGFPALWFVVDGRSKRFNSFAVETRLIIEALENADPDMYEPQTPILAFEAHEPDKETVLTGDPFFIRLRPVQVESPPDTTEPCLALGGIRFEIGVELYDDKKPPVYSFTMAGVTPFLALSAAVERYPGPSSFALELDELKKERGDATPNEP